MLRILIVENDTLVRVTVEEMLATLGHDTVGWATTVPRAIAEAERLRPDLVLMDIQLDGGGDGTEAARTIRDRFDIPSLFTTGGVDHEKRQRAMKARPVGYLQKPFLPSELEAALANVAPPSAPVIVATTLQAVEYAARLLTSPEQTEPAQAKAEPDAVNKTEPKKAEP